MSQNYFAGRFRRPIFGSIENVGRRDFILGTSALAAGAAIAGKVGIDQTTRLKKIVVPFVDVVYCSNEPRQYGCDDCDDERDIALSSRRQQMVLNEVPRNRISLGLDWVSAPLMTLPPCTLESPIRQVRVPGAVKPIRQGRRADWRRQRRAAIVHQSQLVRVWARGTPRRSSY